MGSQLMEFGGPAFACTLQGKVRINPSTKEMVRDLIPLPGMSLHHYFAGQALAGLNANPNVDCNEEVMANLCILHADKMLEAYNKKIEEINADESESQDNAGSKDGSDNARS